MPLLGSDQMMAVARDLKVAGSPLGMRRKLRRNIIAAVEPLKTDVQKRALAIPSKGTGSTGLRASLARATRVAVGTTARSLAVRLMVDGKRMPKGQEALPALVEGDRKWRHPVFGPNSSKRWVAQASHPFVAPAIPRHLLEINAGVNAAVRETADQLAKGG